MSDPVYVSRKVLAERLGLTRQRVGQLIAQGKISETDLGIDLDRALAEYERNTDAEKVEQAKRRFLKVVEAPAGESQPPPAPDAAPSQPRAASHATPADDGVNLFNFNDAKARKEHYNAERARVALEQHVGQLISRDEVKTKEFAVARKLRDRLLGFPARVANFVPPDAMRVLTEEVDALVRELQQDAASIAEAS